MLQDLAAVDTHPLAETAARYVGLLPLLPLAGFLVNGALSLIPAHKRGPADPSAAGHANDSMGDAHAPAHDEASGADGEIVRLETELNARVYELFGLSVEEVAIVEESTKYRYGEV